jgi:hypothetical protein
MSPGLLGHSLPPSSPSPSSCCNPCGPRVSTRRPEPGLSPSCPVPRPSSNQRAFTDLGPRGCGATWTQDSGVSSPSFDRPPHFPGHFWRWEGPGTHRAPPVRPERAGRPLGVQGLSCRPSGTWGRCGFQAGAADEAGLTCSRGHTCGPTGPSCSWPAPMPHGCRPGHLCHRATVTATTGPRPAQSWRPDDLGASTYQAPTVCPAAAHLSPRGCFWLCGEHPRWLGQRGRTPVPCPGGTPWSGMASVDRALKRML